MTMILAKHPVRKEFAGCSSSNKYYKTKNDAIHAFNTALVNHGFSLDFDELVDYNGDNGRANHHILDSSGNRAGCAIFSWHRMEKSGQYEFIGYLA